MQKVIVIRNVAVSADSFEEIYDIEQAGLKLAHQVQPLNEIIFASPSRKTLLTYGQRSIQYLDLESSPLKYRFLTHELGFSVKQIALGRDDSILSAASKQFAKY